MATQIRTWQIINGRLEPIASQLKDHGRTEPYDLEPWIESNPTIVGEDIAIIGRQVMSKSGPIDLLGIDVSGNLVILEIKRDKLPREVLAQAIDYASDVADWTIDKISEVCADYSGKVLEDFLGEAFPDADVEGMNFNDTQRIVLIGFSIESSLERMIKWLSDSFDVNINAVVLDYIKTSNGDELLAKTSLISEELERERVKKRKKFQIPMSDEPGGHEHDTLKKLLVDYLNRGRVTNQRIRDILLPALLRQKTLTREELKQAVLDSDPGADPSKIGLYLTTMSSQLGMEKNDFLRQVIGYEYPTHGWEKDNFCLRLEFRDLVSEILEELKAAKQDGQVK